MLAAASVLIMLGPRRAAVRDLLAPAAGRQAWWLLAVGVAALPLLGLLAAGRNTLGNPTPWYYTDLVRQAVHARGLPSYSYEWATRLPFLDDYPGFIAGTGLLTAAGSHGSLVAEHLVSVAVLFATAIGVFLLARSFGAARLAALLGVVLVLNSQIFGFKLLSFRPEAVGYPLMLLVPVLAREWLRTRRGGVFAIAVAGFAALGQIHGIDWTFGAILLVSAVAVELLGDQERARTARSTAVFLTAAFGGWLLTNALLGHGVSGLSKVEGLPRVANGVDPTWTFFRLVTTSTALHPPSAFDLIKSSMNTNLLGVTGVWTAAAAAVALALLVFGARVSRGDDRWVALRTLAFVVLSFVLLFLVSTLLTVRWETYVPRRTGYSRLLHLWPVLFGVGVAVGMTLLGGRKGRAVMGVIAVLLALVVTVRAYGPLRDVAADHPPEGQTQALRDYRLPEDATVLMNAYTESYPLVAAGIYPVLNGRAPYTEPELLDRANGLLADSRQFFAGPGVPLPCRGITHVLVALDRDWRFATPSVFPTDVGALDTNPGLEFVGEQAGTRLYKVRDGAAAQDRRCVFGRAG